MQLLQLQLKDFRHFNNIEITLHEGINLIHGPNGSGKTSLLEAVYFLGMGKSFRSHQIQPIIRYEQAACQIIGTLQTNSNQQITIGIEKNLKQNLSTIRIAGQTAQSSAELAKLLPLQIMNHQSFQILDAGPQHRRELLDWGVFHIEVAFFPAWQRFHRALKQRNAALKAQQDKAQIQLWDAELISQAEIITRLRQTYLDLYLPLLQEIIRYLENLPEISLSFLSGWDKQKSYEQSLQDNLARDRILGYTQNGPHRADLRIKVNQHEADEVLSRGQQKLLSYACHIAQAKLLEQLTQKACIFLVDDLPAELDVFRIENAVHLLAQLPGQIFITAVNTASLSELFPKYPIHQIAL